MQLTCIVSAFLLFIARSDPCLAQDARALYLPSPKLRQFLHETPTASQTLSNVLVETFVDRTLCLFYFYSEDKSVARAYHDYPDETHVAIYIRENQQPLDEFICLIFEALNSTNERQFLKLFDKAKTGAISKGEFTSDVARLEFDAVKKTQVLLKAIKLARGDRSKSEYYKLFRDAPENFDEFFLYIKRLSSARDVIKELSTKYDLLRNGSAH
jgi:hypothetical protein